MNQKLGSTAREEIRKAMTGLVGAAAAAEVERQADLHGVTKTYVYDMTRDIRGAGKAPRKRRSDAGQRKFELKEGTDVWEAAKLVIGAKLDPDQALLTAKANGHGDLPTLAVFQRMLRQHEIDRKSLRTGRRNHRTHEAEAPLDRVQIDSSALKVRWLDYNTRRIIRLEGVDKNHPQLDPQLLRVWQILAVDDHTRRRFTKYVATNHITSADMVVFFCDLCCAWGGVPKEIYTDNGPEFKALFAQAVRIVASIGTIRDSGGLTHIKHEPGNAQATGKVENAHKRVEKMNKYIGHAQDRGIDITVEMLPSVAEAIDRFDNEVKVHRRTGQTPVMRWYATHVTTRTLPEADIRAALLFQEVDRVLTDTMTVRVGKVDYRIPAVDANGRPSPFKKGMKLKVIVPQMLDEIFVTLPNGEEYAVAKDVATPDVAGDIKKAQPSQGEVLTKKLRDEYKADNRKAKELKKQTGEVYQVPFVNHEVEVPQTTVRHFPHPKLAVSSADLADATPVPMSEISDSRSQIDDSRLPTPDSRPAYIGRPVGYWEAVAEFSDRFATKDAAKAFLLELFPSQQGSVAVTEIEAAIDSFFNPQKEAASIRLAS